jgi:hypothetical protein
MSHKCDASCGCVCPYCVKERAKEESYGAATASRDSPPGAP